jgi:hypothetical protein
MDKNMLNRLKTLFNDRGTRMRVMGKYYEKETSDGGHSDE